MASSRIYCASDRRLYLTGGSNNVTSLYTKAGFCGSVDVESWREIIVKRRSRIEATGAKFVQLFVPEKLTVYPLTEVDFINVFPNEAPQTTIPPGRRLIESIGGQGVIFPDDFLKQQSRLFDVFPRTDSHWTWKGAFSAFQVIMHALKYTPNYQGFVSLPKKVVQYHGDLWETGLDEYGPDSFERVVLPEGIRRVYANSLMGLKEQGLDDEVGLHGGSNCVFSNNEAQFGESVTIFGSSFSEARLAPSLLTAIFAFYFRLVHFVWSSSIDFTYIARNPTDLVIAETPERFITDCPTDTYDLDYAAAGKVRRWKTSRADG